MTSHLWMSQWPIPIYWSLGSEVLNRWYLLLGDILEICVVFSEYRGNGSCHSNWETTLGFGGQGASQNCAGLRTTLVGRKQNAKHLSLEPSFGSRKCSFFFFVFYSFNIQCMQNCVKWEENAILLCRELYQGLFIISKTASPKAMVAHSMHL